MGGTRFRRVYRLRNSHEGYAGSVARSHRSPTIKIMSYAAAVSGLFALSGELANSRRKFELQHMRNLVRAVGDPQQRFPSVLIAGTNGKGSTAATLASILSCAGYRTGLYTSPHLLRINERVQISNTAQPFGNTAQFGNTLAEIDNDTFARLYFQVDDAANRLVRDGLLPHAPSFFETVTAIAFLAFAEAGVDIAVLEVGLGGRLDATNIVDPLASILTDIALDHTEWLGGTLTEIAREKAGILRRNGVLITLPQHPEANAAIGEIAMALDVTGINAAAYLPQPSPRTHAAGGYLVPAFGTALEIAPALQGEHQRRNLALAIGASEYLQSHAGFAKITPAAVVQGVQQVRWPGRLERSTVSGGAAVLLDVAHNPAGIWTLRSFLSRSFEAAKEATEMQTGATIDRLPEPRTLVFSALADKAIQEMAQILFPLFDGPGDTILLAPVENSRSASLERLQQLAAENGGTDTNGGTDATGGVPVAVLDSVAAAYAELREQSQGTIVVAGSVYLVSEWKRATEAEAKEVR